MKWLFGFVFLVNVVVLVWFGWLSNDPSTSRVNRVSNSDDHAIVLLSERREKAVATIPKDATSLAKLAAHAACYSIGPFKSTEEATGAVMQLKSQGWISVSRKAEEKVPRGYWVFLPAASDKETAMKSLREMHKANVDSFLITKGPNTNAISVGIYSDRRHAEERRDELRSKGFKVQLEERHSNSVVFWVDMISQGQGQLSDEIRRRLLIEFQGAEIRQGQCADKITALD